MGRRRALRMAATWGAGLGASLSALTLLGCGSSELTGVAGGTATDTGTGSSAGTTTSTGPWPTKIPEETAGPYPRDSSNGPNVLNLTGVMRSDIRSSFAGLSGTSAGVPLTIELTLVSASTCDVLAKATFTSIFPAGYSGRWPHIHFELYPSLAKATAVANKVATSQIALPKSACDLVYATAGYEQSVRNLSQISLELATMTGSVAEGLKAALTVAVNGA